MVAYSFKPRFVEPIRRGLKKQTIRAPRKRHARQGEMLQLFCGMRTKHCFKIIADPQCVYVGEVRLDFTGLDPKSPPKSNLEAWDILSDRQRIWTDGFGLPRSEWHNFALDDGFGVDEATAFTFPKTGEVMRPFVEMAMFWAWTHGPRAFTGVRILWEPK